MADQSTHSTHSTHTEAGAGGNAGMAFILGIVVVIVAALVYVFFEGVPNGADTGANGVNVTIQAPATDSGATSGGDAAPAAGGATEQSN